MAYISDFNEGIRLNNQAFLVKSKVMALTKAGKDYISTTLIDKTGSIDAKIWDVNNGGIMEFDTGDFVSVSGQITNYNGNLQLKVERIRTLAAEEVNMADYIPSSRFDVEDMYKEMLEMIESIKEEHIKVLLKSFFVEDKEFIKSFKTISAAKTVHHGFAGGLLEHSLSVARMCSHMADNYDFLNRDLLLAAAMLHDVGKVKELSEFPANDYTELGNFMGHIVLGYEMVKEHIDKIEDFPVCLGQELEHCILSHHGELEFGSPKKPAIAEAIALSFADNMDAKMETIREVCEDNANNTNAWFGYNKWLDSNVRRTEI